MIFAEQRCKNFEKKNDTKDKKLLFILDDFIKLFSPVPTFCLSSPLLVFHFLVSVEKS